MEVYNEKVGDLLAHLPEDQLQYIPEVDRYKAEDGEDPVEQVMAGLAALEEAEDSSGGSEGDVAHGAARGGRVGYKGTVASVKGWGVMGPPQGQKDSLVVREGKAGSEVVNLQRIPVKSAPHAMRLIHLASSEWRRQRLLTHSTPRHTSSLSVFFPSLPLLSLLLWLCNRGESCCKSSHECSLKPKSHDCASLVHRSESNRCRRGNCRR